MKEKNYKQKRNELKDEKRRKKSFKSSEDRRNFVDGIKRSYRALKRSERQQTRKRIEKELE